MNWTMDEARQPADDLVSHRWKESGRVINALSLVQLEAELRTLRSQEAATRTGIVNAEQGRYRRLRNGSCCGSTGGDV